LTIVTVDNREGTKWLVLNKELVGLGREKTHFCCCSRECRCGIEVSAAPIILISNFGLLEPRLLSDVIVRGIRLWEGWTFGCRNAVADLL